MRLLIVRLSALGDLVHALPLAVNAHAAGATVGWLVDSSYAPLLRGNPAIQRIFSAATRLWRKNPLRPAHLSAVRALRRELLDFAPDLTIDAQGLWKSAVFARLAGAPVVSWRARDRRERSSGWMVDRPVTIPPGVDHVVDQNLLLLEAAGFPVVQRAPDARYILATGSPTASAFLESVPPRFAAIHPGAARPEKAWGEENYAELARLLRSRGGLFPIVSWGPGDETRAARLSALAEGPAVPALDLPGLSHVISRATLFVSGDTGPLHLADALGVSTLGLFGPASLARNVPRRNRPYRGEALSYDETTAVETVAARALEILRARPGKQS